MGEQISLFWGDPSLPREYLTSSERRLRTRLLDAVWPRTRGHVHVEHRSEVPVRGVGVSRDTPPNSPISRCHDFTTKQATVRLPDDLADEAEAVARVRGTSVNALIVDSLAAEIERVRADKAFTERAKELLERDKELLERLAR
jgi:predicted transcriptional regulator